MPNQRSGDVRPIMDVIREGGGVRDWYRQTPIGQLTSGGGIRGAWNATPIGRLVNALRDRGGNQQASRGPQMPTPTAPGAFGPMADGYAGIPMQPQQPAQAPAFGSEATTNWQALAQALQGQNASANMGVGAYGNPNAASGSWALGQGAMNPLRQSGDTGLGRMRPQQN